MSGAVKVTLAEAETAIRAKVGYSTNPAYRRSLRLFLAVLDWARDV
jgi:hypothetical protein